MQNFREYNEILSIMKKLIDQGVIKITKDSFTIQNLKIYYYLFRNSSKKLIH